MTVAYDHYHDYNPQIQCCSVDSEKGTKDKNRRRKSVDVVSSDLQRKILSINLPLGSINAI